MAPNASATTITLVTAKTASDGHTPDDSSFGFLRNEGQEVLKQLLLSFL